MQVILQVVHMVNTYWLSQLPSLADDGIIASWGHAASGRLPPAAHRSASSGWGPLPSWFGGLIHHWPLMAG